MVAFGNALADELHDALQLLHGAHDPAVYQLQFRYDRGLELVKDALVRIDMLDSVLGLGMVAQEIGLADERVEQPRKVLREARTGREQIANCLREGLGVLQELLGRGFERGEPPVVVVELWVRGLCGTELRLALDGTRHMHGIGGTYS